MDIKYNSVDLSVCLQQYNMNRNSKENLWSIGVKNLKIQSWLCHCLCESRICLLPLPGLSFPT